jgi:predicted nucleic acid-binding protein
MPSGLTELVVVDSNILIYAVDASEQEKALRANTLLEAIEAAQTGITNSQILIEFYASTARARGDRAPLLSPMSAAVWNERWLAMLAFRPLTEAVFREAMRGAVQHQMNIFDAQIWAAAKLAGATVLTEDMQSSDMIEGVRYINPFADDFAFSHIGL